MTLEKPLDLEAIVAGLTEGLDVRKHQTAYGAGVTLCNSVAWTGVSVNLWDHWALEAGESWKVDINWPSCGSQDVAAAEEFVALMSAAIAVAKRLEHAVGIRERL